MQITITFDAVTYECMPLFILGRTAHIYWVTNLQVCNNRIQNILLFHIVFWQGLYPLIIAKIPAHVGQRCGRDGATTIWVIIHICCHAHMIHQCRYGIGLSAVIVILVIGQHVPPIIGRCSEINIELQSMRFRSICLASYTLCRVFMHIHNLTDGCCHATCHTALATHSRT